MQPIEITRIQGGKTFKLTITADGNLRIKSFIGADANLERLWVERCKEICNYFIQRPYDKTLRARTKAISSALILQTDNRKCAFYVYPDSTQVVETN